MYVRFLSKDRFCFENKCLFKTDIDYIKSTREYDKDEEAERVLVMELCLVCHLLYLL